MSTKKLARPEVLGIGLISTAFIAYAVYLAWGETLDDAAISLAYAKHLVEGDGLVLSRGAEPVEGYSNFLWVLLMAPLIAVGLDAIMTAKVFGLALSLVALFLLARLPSYAGQRDIGWLDLLAPALTALSLPFALWSLSAMENGLEAFLLVAVVALSIRELKDEKALPWSSVAFFALAITRPEGIVYWIAAVGHRGLLTFVGRSLSRRDALWAACVLAPFALYHAWHYQYFGELVPNTYFAKADHRSVSGILTYLTNASDPGVVYVRSFLFDYWLLPLIALLPLSILGRDNLRMYSLPLLLLLAGTSAAFYVGGDWMEYHRFFSPLAPLLFLGVQEGFRRLGTRLEDLLGSLIILQHRIGRVVLAGLIILVVAIPNATIAPDAHQRPFGAPYSSVLAHARYLEELALSLGADHPVVLTPDIGAVALDTDLAIVDLGGLGDAHVARRGSGPELTDYVFGERRPDVIRVHGPWVESTQITRDVRFWTDYMPIALGRDSNRLVEAATLVRNDLTVKSDDCEDAVTWRRRDAVEGEQVTVRGFIEYGTRLVIPEPVTMIRAVGDERLVVAVEQSRRVDFLTPPESAYLGKAVCATGTVGHVQQTPVVFVKTPDDIHIDSSARIWAVAHTADLEGIAPAGAPPGELASLAALAGGRLSGLELDDALERHAVDYVIVPDGSAAATAIGYGLREIHATGFSVHEVRD